MKRSLSDAEWMDKNFPSRFARIEADEAIDEIDVKVPMVQFLDAWFAAYVATGGRTRLKP